MTQWPANTVVHTVECMFEMRAPKMQDTDLLLGTAVVGAVGSKDLCPGAFWDPDMFRPSKMSEISEL